MFTLRLSDRCHGVPPELQGKPATVSGDELLIRGEGVFLDGQLVAVRIEPHGFGDVHWEAPGEGPVSDRRYTHIFISHG